jgi:HAMP domain-containing protein
MSSSQPKKRLGNNWSLTTKITIAFLVASLLPLIFISAYQLIAGSVLLEDMANEELHLSSFGTAGRIDQLFEDNKVAALQLSSDPTVINILTNPDDTQAKAEAEARFQDLLESNPYYEFVYLMDVEGLTLVSRQLEGLPSVEGRNFKDREYFLRAREGFQHIDALVGRVSQELGFYFTAPVYNEFNQVIGVAAIKLQGVAVTEMINRINEESKSASVFLVDFDGVVVSAPEHRPDWRLKGLQALTADKEKVVEERFVLDEALLYVGIPELTELMEYDSGILDYYDDLNGDYHIVGYQATENLNWVVGVSLSESVFMEPIFNLARQSAIAGAILSAIVVLLAVILARGIARPVNKLAKVAQDVEEDKPFAPEDIADVTLLGDEVGHLARVFSKMVLALRARMAELRTIHDISHKIAGSVDLTDTLSEIVDSLSHVIDFDATEICLYDDKEKDLELYLTNVGVMSDDETVEKVSYNPKNDYFPRLFGSQDAMVISNIEEYVEHSFTTQRSWDAYNPNSYLGIALWHGKKVVGTIEMINSHPNGFSEDNSRIIESIALNAASAIHNAQEVKNRERRLMNMEIVVDDESVDEELKIVTGRDFFQSIKKKAKARRSD